MGFRGTRALQRSHKSWTILVESLGAFPILRSIVSLLLANLQHYSCARSLVGCSRKISNQSSLLATTWSGPKASLGRDVFCILWWWVPQGPPRTLLRWWFSSPETSGLYLCTRKWPWACFYGKGSASFSLSKAQPLHSCDLADNADVLVKRHISKALFYQYKASMLSDPSFIPYPSQCCIRWHSISIFLPQTTSVQYISSFSSVTYFTGLCHICYVSLSLISIVLCRWLICCSQLPWALLWLML